MGRVISTDTQKGASTPALTETGQGGLFSTGYLRDDPAGEYVGDGETVAFVVTNAEKGVTRERDEERTEIKPGDGYRTIAVVTDRRVIVLVGDGDGDERVTLPLIEVRDAGAAEGDLLVEMSEETWRVYAGDGDVADVADYVRRVAATWDELERELDAVKRQLVEATADRDDGAYESGIDAAQTAYDRLDDAAALVEDLAEDGPAGALDERVDHVRDRCVGTVADVRLGHGRSIADDAEARWRDEEWETAFDAYERARAEFEAVAALDQTRHDESTALERCLERVDEATEQLAEAPLQRAIDADRRASDADDPAAAVADWRTALEWYGTALALDEDEPERRFAGDPEKVTERVETVTDRLLATAADDGPEALAAGKWYLEADRPGVAREELLVAETIFEEALAVAREARPDEVDDLEEWLSETTETLEAATDEADVDADEADVDADVADVEADEADIEADVAGVDTDEADIEAVAADVEVAADEESTGDAETAEDAETTDDAETADDETPVTEASRTEQTTAETDDLAEPAAGDVGESDAEGGAVEETASPQGPTVGIDDRPAGNRLDAVTGADSTAGDAVRADDLEAVVSDGAGTAIEAHGAGAAIPVQLRALDPEGFDSLARELVESMGWTPEDAPAGAPYDLLATRSDPEGTVAIRTIHRPMAGPVDADQVGDATDLHDEVPDGGGVMLVTSSGVTEPAVKTARHRSVRLVDEDYITTVLASGGTDDLFERIRPQPSD